MKIRFTAIIPVLLFLTSLSLSAEEAFIINHYQIDMNVRENNSYEITETIDLDFSARRHGIIREIPLFFDNMPVRISNISVPGFKTGIDRDKKNIQIRIGSEDEFVEGKISYSISYTYDVGADNLKDMDEFNHNVIGTQWDTTIESADFRINLPKPFNPDDANCTSGEYGSTDNSKVKWSVSGTTITGRLLAPLNNYEGLTVALPLEEGYWVGAVTHHKPGWLLFTIFGYPLYVLMIILAFALWYTKGRDNKLFPSVEFEAPENLTPAEIGYIIDGSVDPKDVTSLLIYWADKGYLAIEEEKSEKGKSKKLILEKLKSPGQEAKSYERHIFKKLFEYAEGDRVSTSDLTNKFYTTVSWAQENIEKIYTEKPEQRIFAKGSVGFTFLAGFMATLPVFMILTEALSALAMDGPFFLLSLPASLLIVIPVLILGKALSGQMFGSKKPAVIAAVIGILFLLVFGALSVIVSEISLYKYLVATVSCFIVSIFASIMSRRTEYGDKILEKVLGFREFIKTAEKDKLEVMFESNPGYFYNILPYAVVLGLSSKWSAHFDGLAVEPPSWYRGYHYNTFNTRDFEKNLNRSISTLNSSLSSSPSSSSGSSSSGGFSGGGSGGGGGSSW